MRKKRRLPQINNQLQNIDILYFRIHNLFLDECESRKDLIKINFKSYGVSIIKVQI